VDRADPEAALSARRLFARTLAAQGESLTLDAEAAQHARVLRLGVGAEVELFDGRGASARARVEEVGKGGLRCVVCTPIMTRVQPARVVLVQCLPKAGKLDDIVRMTTELGVAEIALAISEYCVSKATRAADHKLERLERIAIEAARQAEQPFVPTLHAPLPLAEVLARVPEDAYRVACMERTETPLPAQLTAPSCWLAIGPEGGFSARDRAQLAAASFTSFALGASILRTETAAVVGVALALERFGRGR
jgi:16S rRNA (uracil1498-N3)-methyltransferase